MIPLLALLLAGTAFATDAVTDGRKLYAANRLEEARRIFAGAVRSAPGNTTARMWLAFTQLALGELEPALMNMERLEAVCAHDAEYLFAYSEASTRRARQLSEAVAALGDSSARAHQLLAYRYKARGEWRIAVKELRRAAELRPRLAGVHLDAAEILWEQQQFEEAGAELEAELRVHPSGFLANLRYGQLLLRRRSPDAVPPIETAARYQRYPEAHVLLGLAWEQRGDPERAAAVLSGGLALFPGNSDLLEARSRLWSRFPEVKNASGVWSPAPLRETAPDSPALRRALARNPRDEDALFLLSQRCADTGEKFFQRLEQEAPDSHRVWQMRGLQAESAGDLRLAETCYRKVLEKQPELAGAHFDLGLILQKLGDTESSNDEYHAELRIDPNHYLAAYELGSSLARNGDTRAGLPWLERAVHNGSSFVEAKVELARAYISLGQFRSALPLLRDAVSKAPQHPSAHFLLHRCYRALGETAEAQAQLAVHERILRNGQPTQSGMSGPQGPSH